MNPFRPRLSWLCTGGDLAYPGKYRECVRLTQGDSRVVGHSAKLPRVTPEARRTEIAAAKSRCPHGIVRDSCCTSAEGRVARLSAPSFSSLVLATPSQGEHHGGTAEERAPLAFCALLGPRRPRSSPSGSPPAEKGYDSRAGWSSAS